MLQSTSTHSDQIEGAEVLISASSKHSFLPGYGFVAQTACEHSPLLQCSNGNGIIAENSNLNKQITAVIGDTQ